MKIFDDKNIKINLPVLIDSRALLCANSGGFNNALSRLNSLGLIIKLKNNIKLNSEILER